MNAYEIAMAREIARHAAPEYVVDYLSRLSDEEQTSIFNEVGAESLISDLKERRSSIIETWLAFHEFDNSDVDQNPNDIPDSVLVARMFRHSPASIDEDYPPLAKLAYAQCGEWISAYSEVFENASLSFETGQFVLRGIITNPNFLRGCNYEGSYLEYDLLMSSIINYIRGSGNLPQPLLGKRALVIQDLFEAAPRLKISFEDAAACVDAILKLWKHDGLLHSFTCLCAKDCEPDDAVYHYLQSHDNEKVRSGFYAGTRSLDLERGKKYIEADGVLFARSVIENDMLYTYGLGDLEREVDRLISDNFEYSEWPFVCLRYKQKEHWEAYQRDRAIAENDDAKREIFPRSEQLQALEDKVDLLLARAPQSGAGSILAVGVVCVLLGLIVGLVVT